MQIKRKTTVTLRTKKDAEDIFKKRPVTIRISCNGSRIEIPTGVAVSLADWDAAAGRAKPCNKSADEINAAIGEYRIAISDTFKSYELAKELPDPPTIKKDILARVIGKKEGEELPPEMSLKHAINRYALEYGPTRAWSRHTYQVLNTLRRDLTGYRKNIDFRHLDEAGLAGFLEWLRHTKKVNKLKRSGDKPGERGVKDSTLKKSLSTLKMFLRWAEAKGYPVNKAYKTFKPRFRQVNNAVIFLTEDELKKIASTPLTEKERSLSLARDLLLFCCYTGLRYSDVENLRKSDVHDGYMDVTTIKTADAVRIEFNKVSEYIIGKYKDVDIPGGRAIPTLSNQKTNANLKKLCKKAGIDSEEKHTYFKGDERREVRGPKYQFISTHTGRRTFICSGLAKNIPVHVVMKWTGHSSYATMKPYIDAADSVKAEEMKRYDTTDILGNLEIT